MRIAPINVEDNKQRILLLLNTVKREGIQDLIKYLCESDYFTAPASTRFHNAVPGGLAAHSLNVYVLLKHFCKIFEINVSDETIILTSLCHDLCKVGCYHIGEKRVPPDAKENVSGKWETQKTWIFDDPIPYGHGEKSVIIMEEYIKLTTEEIMAVRYHMGPFLESDKEKKDWNSISDLYPLCKAISMADQGAGYFMETDKILIK